MNLADAETAIRGLAADAEALVRDHLPVIHDAAAALASLTASPVVAELQQLAEPLDPALEQALAAIIRGAGEAAAKLAAATAPEPAVPVGVDAEPDPEVPAG